MAPRIQAVKFEHSQKVTYYQVKSKINTVVCIWEFRPGFLEKDENCLWKDYFKIGYGQRKEEERHLLISRIARARGSRDQKLYWKVDDVYH